MKNNPAPDKPVTSSGRHPMDMAWGKLRANRVAMVCLAVLVCAYLTAIFAPFLSPYDYRKNELEKSFMPPVELHFRTPDGKFTLRPFIYEYRMADRAETRYEQDKSRMYPIHFFVEGEPYQLFGLIPAKKRLFGVESPARISLLGADQYGRDVFSRLLMGGQISLSIGLIGCLITFPLGLLVGGLSGYYGGRWDTLIMRSTEVLMSIPGLYLILSLRASFPQNMTSTQVYLMIVMILSFIGWAGFSRVIRGMVLSEREKPYVAAARALGQKDIVIIVRHILPSTLSYCIVAATLSIPGYILGEAVLSFIGVGIQEPDTSWGLMLAQAQSHRVLTSFWWILSPGFVIFAVVLAFNFLGDGLRDALDPKMKVMK
ncbi:ABC transporter permease [Kamptonema cortianum]|nr:ABC transporter permease [Kamptonema cortianum]MDL5044515.1 ABC transporter permease [Oscillatoria amoena NRMC-F 0135]